MPAPFWSFSSTATAPASAHVSSPHLRRAPELQRPVTSSSALISSWQTSTMIAIIVLHNIQRNRPPKNSSYENTQCNNQSGMALVPY
mmetsp:Transcript_36348/g.77512  ORF Transcript_36348/g.77512 Transcript_36348/m.77512 type:complete len:87 (-) Transcript_36348:131-391(-)